MRKLSRLLLLLTNIGQYNLLNININCLVLSAEHDDIPLPPPQIPIYTTEEKMKQKQGNNYIKFFSVNLSLIFTFYYGFRENI